MWYLVLFQTSGPQTQFSAFEALEIQVVFKNIISRRNVHQRVDKFSEELAKEKLCTDPHQILALLLDTSCLALR